MIGGKQRPITNDCSGPVGRNPADWNLEASSRDSVLSPFCVFLGGHWISSRITELVSIETIAGISKSRVLVKALLEGTPSPSFCGFSNGTPPKPFWAKVSHAQQKRSSGIHGLTFPDLARQQVVNRELPRRGWREIRLGCPTYCYPTPSLDRVIVLFHLPNFFVHFPLLVLKGIYFTTGFDPFFFPVG